MPNLYLKNPTEIANLTKEDASTILKPLNLPVQKEGNTIKDDIDLKPQIRLNLYTYYHRVVITFMVFSTSSIVILT